MIDPRPAAQVRQWLIRLADGDRSAFDPLFAALWPLLSRVATRLLPHSADAEDAAQQALLRVFARAGAFDRRRDALPWILGILVWECRTLRRRAQRRREQRLPDGEALAALAAVDSAESAVVERDLLAAVEEALGTLPAGDREAILAAVRDGPRPAGAAFRKRLERARRRLRAAWRLKHGTK